ncbi:MAG: Hsp20/alpha crystallin family protein [Bacteroidota bacterium]
MPTIVRRSNLSVMENRREIVHTLSWRVQSILWSPPTDLSESTDAFVVRVEIAGMREQDFNVVLENDVLTISGSRTDPAERRAFHQMEIRFGKFATAVALPSPVEVDQAHAEYKDGFLTVTLPKTGRTSLEDK